MPVAILGHPLSSCRQNLEPPDRDPGQPPPAPAIREMRQHDPALRHKGELFAIERSLMIPGVHHDFP